MQKSGASAVGCPRVFMRASGMELSLDSFDV